MTWSKFHGKCIEQLAYTEIVEFIKNDQNIIIQLAEPLLESCTVYTVLVI